MHSVYDQSEAHKYVCKICLEHDEMCCGQCVRVRSEEEESNMCGLSEVSRQVPTKSRSTNNTTGGGTTTSKTTDIISTFELRERGTYRQDGFRFTYNFENYTSIRRNYGPWENLQE